MECCALASGSSGNCFYVGNDSEGILVDAGISAKQILTRLESINGSPQKIRALFLTHEHIDHVRGADVIARKLNIPIFATKATLQNCFVCSNKNLIHVITTNKLTTLGNLSIEAFSKSHGAADPVSYTISEKKRISVITDAGYVCDNIKHHVSNSDIVYLESNHDEEMLEQGSYPYFLKKWIKGDKGHLSNHQAAMCIKQHSTPRLQRVILSHLSANNNTPERALQTFHNVLKENLIKPTIEVSLREMPSQMITI